MKHWLGVTSCLVAHFDGEGPCRKCRTCGEWLRPSQQNDECSGDGPKMTVGESLKASAEENVR
jgi:hypothetical protein